MVILNEDIIGKIRPSQRKKLIIDLCGKKIKDNGEVTILNDLVLYESKSILKKKCIKCNVQKGLIDTRKFRLGKCYSNSVEMMLKGYGYVEGYVISKDGNTISHSWNVDKEGNYWDFTFKNPGKYEYFGVVIPDDVVINVGKKNGKIWYSVLPFVDENFNLKEYRLD